MKNPCLFLFILFSNLLNAQISFNDFPINLNTLAKQKSFALETVLPRYQDGQFYYYNEETRQKEFDTAFEEAYPFIGKSDNYKLPSYADEANLIIFSEDFIFDLRTGSKSENGYIYCAEPAVPNFNRFANAKGKTGIKNNSDETIIEARYDTIIDIHFDFFVVQDNDKIGVLDLEGNTIIPLRYEAVTFSRGDYYASPQKIGLMKEGNWSYFNLSDSKATLITSSKEKCFQMHDLSLKESVGVFQKGSQVNILFENGKTLSNDYNWISENGLVGIISNSIHFLNADGGATLYYK